MATYLDIIKIKDNLTEATFNFTKTDGATGTFKINKLNGHTELLTPMLGDDGNSYEKAAHKVRKSLSLGVIPDKLVWAS
jgi:hypothetical protein